MTEPQTITADHLRRLLDAASDDATLALIEGRVEVIEPEQASQLPGALEVIARGGLAARLGADPSDEALDEEAASLTVAAQQIGG